MFGPFPGRRVACPARSSGLRPRWTCAKPFRASPALRTVDRVRSYLRRRMQEPDGDPVRRLVVAAAVQGGIVMAIDFTLTPQQKEIQETARDFAENILRPVVRAAD